MTTVNNGSRPRKGSADSNSDGCTRSTLEELTDREPRSRSAIGKHFDERTTAGRRSGQVYRNHWNNASVRPMEELEGNPRGTAKDRQGRVGEAVGGEPGGSPDRDY